MRGSIKNTSKINLLSGLAKKTGTILLALAFFMPMARCNPDQPLFNTHTEPSQEKTTLQDYEYFYPFKMISLKNAEASLLYFLGFFWPLGFWFLERKIEQKTLGVGIYLSLSLLTGAFLILIVFPIMFHEPYIGFYLVFLASALLIFGFGANAFTLLKARVKKRKGK